MFEGKDHLVTVPKGLFLLQPNPNLSTCKCGFWGESLMGLVDSNDPSTGFSDKYGSLPLLPDGSHVIETRLGQKLNLCFHRKGNVDVVNLVCR